MKYIRYYIAIAFLVIFTRCQDFEEIEKNPNQTITAPPSLILTGIQNDMLEAPWSLEHRWNQYWCCNYNYYGNNEYSWTNATLKFQTLKNVLKMEEEALSTGAKPLNPYAALGKFFRAYFFVRMTQQVGDLPLEDALQGLENSTPVYASQKDIYLQVLAWLESANSDLTALIAAGTPAPTSPLGDILSGDIYLGNSLQAWQKIVNSFALRVLISLSKKESDADLNIKNRFNAIVSNPAKYPLLTSAADNLQIYYNGSTSLYPTNPGSRGLDKGRYNMAEMYVKTLTDLEDPRVFVTCNPAEAKLKAGIAFDSFDAYVGASSAESLDDMASEAGKGEYSYANQLRYYGTYSGPEPALMVGYAEQNFNIAEAVNRGWITGDAETFYKNGITASMEVYGIKDGSSLKVTTADDAVLGEVTPSVTNYLNHVMVKYAGNNATGLTQILTQKYLAFFQNSGLEAYYNQRRTGVPAFREGTGTGNNGVIPKRWLYPSAEETTNADNLNKAIQSQFGAMGDNKNAEIYSIKD
jgi:hypothetical protein